MSMYHTRKVTFRITHQEYADAMRVCEYRFTRTWQKATISRLMRALLSVAIEENKRREADEQAKGAALAATFAEKKGGRK